MIGSSPGTKGIVGLDYRPRVNAAARLAKSWSPEYAYWATTEALLL